MKYVEMFGVNREISKIGFGGIPIQKLDKAQAVKVLAHAFDRGINYIDTARGYSVSEEYVGAALKQLPRKEIVLATKCPALDYDNMKKGIETSLKTMQVDYIDLYQVHNIATLANYDKAMEQGAFAALEEAKQKGQILNIGVTSHIKSVLERAVDELSGKICSIMYPYNIIETQGEDLFEKAYKNKISVIIMKPICGGNLSDVNLFDKCISERVSKLKTTLGKLALRFTAVNKYVTCVIPGMASEEEIDENTSINFEEFTPDELEVFDLLRKSLDNSICRRCNYCAPCTVGIDIPTMFTLQNYLKNYDLAEWALSRFTGLAKNADNCIGCGVCETRCPYNLPIRDKLHGVSRDFNDYIKNKQK
ncbi:MAG: aldo/keto reductase [Clostridia bacterium]|nr:aldo/keto reductase [Clostridia bacterium]